MDSPQKKKQKTVSGDPKNYNLGCLDYPKEHQTKSFEGKILKKNHFLCKNQAFLSILDTSSVNIASKILENI